MFDFYSTHSVFSDPGHYAALFCDLPTDIKSLVSCVNQLLFHYADQSLYDYTIPASQYRELDYRLVKNTLSAISNKSSATLSIPRAHSQKVLGICRDSALMTCSILRSRGISARLRSGFNTYYLPNLFLDGFCLEYFDETIGRWRLVDTRTTQDYIHHFHLSINFDLTNLSEKNFIPAALAWTMCRSGSADPSRFGSRGYYGLNYIRNKVIQDFVLLNKYELLIWDLWGDMLADKKMDNTIIDNLSDFLLKDACDVEKIMAFYEESLFFQVPNTVLVANPFLSERWENLSCFH